MDDSGRRDELVGGWGGPLRRWRAMDAHDRRGTLLLAVCGAVCWAASYWVFAQLFDGGATWSGVLWWTGWMLVVWVYQPELVRTFKKWND